MRIATEALPSPGAFPTVPAWLVRRMNCASCRPRRRRRRSCSSGRRRWCGATLSVSGSGIPRPGFVIRRTCGPSLNASASTRDVASLRDAGFDMETPSRYGEWEKEATFRRAPVRREAEVVKIDWAADSAFRFFPIER